MSTILERYAVKPRHVEAFEPLWRRQAALREAAGFTIRRAFLETDAEPKLTCLMEHRDSLLGFDALDRLEHLERSAEHRTLATSMAPHVFRNRVVRAVDPWTMTTATPESVAGTHGERIAIMRRYEIVNGWPGFEDVWRRIVPVRERYGFRCLFAVADRGNDIFTWAFDFDGGFADFAASQHDYYRDPDRVELRKVFDFMADYSIHPARQLLV